MSRHSPLLALAAALALCSACGDSGGPVLGTGSAGGNPLTLAFSHDPASTRDGLVWETPVMHVDLMRLAYEGAAGDCNPAQFEEIAVRQTFTFERLVAFVFEPPYPCGIVLTRPSQQPFLTIEAEVDDSKRVRVEIWGDPGLRLTLDEPQRLDASQDVFVVIKLDRLLDQLDFVEALRDEDTVVYSDRPPAGSAQADQVRTNFIAGARIYLDPTPGDGVLTDAEQTPENVIGRASFGVLE